jgi:hypothetical protein
LSITVTTKFTAVPEVTYWLCEGETLTLGFAAVQDDDPFIVICTVAPLPLTATRKRLRWSERRRVATQGSVIERR